MASTVDLTGPVLSARDAPLPSGCSHQPPAGPIRVSDADLSTVTAEGDKVDRVDGPNPYLVPIETQAGADRTLPRRHLRYNALLDVRTICG